MSAFTQINAENSPANQQQQHAQNDVTAAEANAANTLQNSRVANEILNINLPACASSSTLLGSPPGIGSITVATPTSDTTSGFNMTLMQSSPPPHSYRHSRAYRHFKNPPQPHMCIRTTTEAGEELFINVLSWTRIVIPQEPSDPIPLYGGMRVPPGSPRSPPIVFAVMANPEVLKDSGRHSKDPEERRAMVELMCDFVEAMNPGVKLVRNAVILKDRDISGELKDVWNAVQAQRDREREEQIMQQRQQQHYHNVTTQQMFPKSPETTRLAQQTKSDEENNKILNEKEANDNRIDAQNPATAIQQNLQNKTAMEQQEATFDNISNERLVNGGNGDGIANDKALQNINSNESNSSIQQNNMGNDQIDAVGKATTLNNDSNKYTNANTNASLSATENPQYSNNHKIITTPTSPTSPTNATTTTLPTATATNTTTIVAPVKKEKLGGFLPNGCIFPRFKNNKHKEKDKDKDKDKESKPKEKEKTLLNALKKSKEKKVAPIELNEKTATVNDTKTQYEKNCINLESEVQKLDLNKIDSNTSNDNMFIKLKVAATSAAAK